LVDKLSYKMEIKGVAQLGTGNAGLWSRFVNSRAQQTATTAELELVYL